MINICIIHYNTPKLTEYLIKSINKFTPNSHIYIFDNSDKSPFLYQQENITYFDNTKGQIINFNEWLKNFPNRNLSSGRINGWGSAKHCYSVEKCMDLIGDNFILLDSDVLLKRDISDLYSINNVYSAEIITQPKSTIKRVLPFICFINVKLCKKNNIHYFDANYMHGLKHTQINKSADSYDTGAGFYINTLKFPHKSILINDYIEHLGSASWKNKKMTEQDWLNKYKKLWCSSMNKNNKVIYTCITGGYDSLLEPSKILPDFDYVCFTDNLKITSSIWDIRCLPKEVELLSNVKKQRFIKINPHICLPEYDLSVWVDGNVDIRGDINKLILNKCSEGSIFVPLHPQRKCIYKEADICIRIKKDTADNIMPQIQKYKNEGFPANYGLLQSNIMIRKHNSKDCISIMEDWWNEVKMYSHRDQLSFNYVCWKHSEIKVTYLDKNIYCSEYFKWGIRHKKVLAKQLPKLPHIAVISTDTEEKEDKKIEKVIDIISDGIHSEIKPKTHFKPQMRIRKSPSVAIKHFLNS